MFFTKPYVKHDVFVDVKNILYIWLHTYGSSTSSPEQSDSASLSNVLAQKMGTLLKTYIWCVLEQHYIYAIQNIQSETWRLGLKICN